MPRASGDNPMSFASDMTSSRVPLSTADSRSSRASQTTSSPKPSSLASTNSSTNARRSSDRSPPIRSRSERNQVCSALNCFSSRFTLMDFSEEQSNRREGCWSRPLCISSSRISHGRQQSDDFPPERGGAGICVTSRVLTNQFQNWSSRGYPKLRSPEDSQAAQWCSLKDRTVASL
jgi:hypothetical protein